MVATVNSKKSSHPLNWWLYGREFGGCCQSHCVFNSSWAALLASEWDYWKHKPVSDDRVTERKKLISAMCEACDMLSAWIFIPPCHKNCDKGRHSATQIHSGDDFFFLWFQFDSAEMTPMEVGRRDALVCEIKVFSMIQTWQQARQKNTNFPLLPSFQCFWSCAPFCHSIWASEISHRRSHLLCLRLICLLTGSHQSLLRPGGIPSVWDKVWALGSTELSDSSYFSLSSCDEHRFLSFPSVMKSKVVEKCH